MAETENVKTSMMLRRDTAEKLEKLCEMDYRGKSDMIDWLIAGEWARRFHAPSPATIEEAEAAMSSEAVSS